MQSPRTRARRWALATAVALFALAFAPPLLAEPTAEAKAGARAAALKGITAFDEKRYADALDLFTRAESLMHAPTHVLMIARSQAALGKLVAARESYVSLAREPLAANAPTAFKEAKADAAKELRELEPRVPSIDVRLSDPAAEDVVITMDGKPLPAALVGVAHPVDPGTHVLSARGKAVAADEVSVQVEEGAQVAVVLELRAASDSAGGAAPEPSGDAPPPPSSNGMRIAGFVGVGLGVVGIGVGATLAGLGVAERGEADDAYAACGAAACVRGSPAAENVNALDDSASTKQTAGVVSLVAGGVLAAVGVTLIVISPQDEAAAAAVRIGPGALEIRGSF